MDQTPQLEEGWIAEEREEEGTQRVVAYVVRDPLWGAFEILKKAAPDGRPAWWEDSAKLDRLIAAFKSGHLIKDALFYAGVSEDGWFRFNEVHPEFRSVKEACESVMRFAAMDTANKGIRDDPRLAFRYLERTHPSFKTKVKVETDQPLSQTVNVAVSGDVDTAKIEEAVAAAARAIISQRGAASDSAEDGGQGMEAGSEGGGG